jgi:hypothetical protein
VWAKKSRDEPGSRTTAMKAYAAVMLLACVLPPLPALISNVTF